MFYCIYIHREHISRERLTSCLPNMKATIYPVKMPTFLDQLNADFARFLAENTNQHVKINSDTSTITWNPCLLTRSEGINWETMPYLESEKFTKM